MDEGDVVPAPGIWELFSQLGERADELFQIRVLLLEFFDLRFRFPLSTFSFNPWMAASATPGRSASFSDLSSLLSGKAA